LGAKIKSIKTDTTQSFEVLDRKYWEMEARESNATEIPTANMSMQSKREILVRNAGKNKDKNVE